MKDLTYSEAVETILKYTLPGKITELDLARETAKEGYTLAEDIKADRDFPPFNRSAMDGFAIRSTDYKKDTVFKVIGTLLAGEPDTHENPYGKGDSSQGPFALRIMTGAPVPLWADAVIRFEDSQYDDYMKTVIFFRNSAEPWMNIARRAEDAAKGSVLLAAGSPVNNSTLPVIAAAGASKIKVRKKPNIFLVTTGTEVVGIDEIPLDHQIRDSSSQAIRFMAEKLAIHTESRRVADDFEKIREALIYGLENFDILLVTGGVSRGITDKIPDILKDLGVTEIFHRAKIKPGKPVFFGIKDMQMNGSGGTKRVLVFGLPGNPVSSQVNYKIFVEESIAKISGKDKRIPLRLPLARKKVKKHELTEFTQCRYVIHNGLTCLEPVSHHGSGDFVNLALTDGLMVHPADQTELEEGTPVDFYPW